MIFKSLVLILKSLFWGTCLFVLWLVSPFIASPFLDGEYGALMNRSSSFAIFDRNGESLGVLPGVIDLNSGFDAEGLISEDHRSVVPAFTRNYRIYSALIRTLEDRNFGTLGIRSIHGTDVPRTLKGVLTLGESGGGSGLSQQLLRNLHHRSPYGETTKEKLFRKAFELMRAPALFRILGADGVVRAYATHIPLVSSNPSVPLGGDIYGVELSASALFGHKFEDCSPAEVGLLAAAAWRPVILTRLTDRCGWVMKTSRFEGLRTRAEVAFKLAPHFFPGEIPADLSVSSIEVLEVMPPPRMVHEKGELWGKTVTSRLANSTNPSRRALQHKAAMIESLAELSKMTDGSWRTVVREVHLSLKGQTDLEVRHVVGEKLGKMETSGKFKIPLNSGPRNQRAQIVVAVADQDGELIALYTNQDTPIYSTHSLRFIGSTGKIMAAIAMGSAGFNPNTMLLNKATGGIQNPNGNKGCKSARQSGCMYRAVEVFARSLNLPIIWGLGRSARHGVDLDGLISNCGFQIEPTVPAATAITLGELRGSPRKLHSLVSELLAVLDGEAAPGFPIRLITGIECFSSEDPRETYCQEPSTGLHPAIQSYLGSPDSRKFVSRVLAAPMQPGGTFARLRRFTPAHCRKIILAIAKGGTVVDRAGGSATDLLACGGLVFRDSEYRRISWVVVIRSPSPLRPLGKVSSSDLQPLIAGILGIFVSH